ncbi:hypothetical protein IU433_03000 [Nocardia puris]|uniref:Uncharacterized protein n=1 Tax=Nocardia puris TaxID=208602 RepID=A0A366DVR7_9NOCA|nr:hypothetical protein [Nocardia puris]MBF6210080.1 hypothetical protein [Nocardia puris]MBF6368271.1 hypothetical protein [Nocardia puris]MBF6458010.1 hypothetical protein [Nocardia puris]RBO94172.1 hypothetical protein DFR74_102594 [Nocardia puris]
MAKVDAVRLSSVLGIDVAQAMLRLRHEKYPGETEHETCLRLIAEDARRRRHGA